MADFQHREKLKKLEEAAVNNNVPAKANNIGIGCFLLGTIIFICFLLFLSISLYFNEIFIGSIITFMVALVFAFILFKLWTAPKLP